MDLWEKSGTGNEDVKWLRSIREAIAKKVPPPSDESWGLHTTQAIKILSKKRNWSAPGPDKLVNYWWKRAQVLNEGVAEAFVSISESTEDYPAWFSEGKTKLIPKSGEFTSENQRPITCLNNMYKWFTSCPQYPIDSHLTENELMENEQRCLSLRYPNPSFTLARRPEVGVEGTKIKELLKCALIDKLQETVKAENWHGRLFTSRWKDEELSQDACFAWMKDWSLALTHTVAGMIELYEQLLPTKVYTTQKTKTTQGDLSCRLCGNEAKTLPHILSGCSTLAQSKCLDRHNAALKILFFEKCKDLKLVESVPPWYLPVNPKPIYESDKGKAFWDVAVYAEHTYV